MILTKEQLPVFYDEIKNGGHECDEEKREIRLKLPDDISELWIVSEIESAPDRYQVKWSSPRMDSADDCAEYKTSPQGSHIIEAAWQKATQ